MHTLEQKFIICDGYRQALPYFHDFVCDAKRRWVGRSILDVFAQEFPFRDRAYYELALADGRLRVEGLPWPVAPGTPLQDGWRLRHTIHCHEPRVPATPIQVVGESPNLVAVCKPAGVPVHPTGLYRRNTVVGILSAERPELGPLLPVHRLDRPVSGLLLFARSSAAAEELCRKMQEGAMEKVYVARVLGAFPATDKPLLVDMPLNWDPSTSRVFPVPDATHTCTSSGPAAEHLEGYSDPQGQQGQEEQHGGGEVQGKGQMQRQLVQGGMQQQLQGRASKEEWRAAKQTRWAAKQERLASEAKEAVRDSGRDPKPAQTLCRLLWVAPDGKTSIVECRPLTGRSHQIRAHLQWLGHPIANDLMYGGTFRGLGSAEEATAGAAAEGPMGRGGQQESVEGVLGGAPQEGEQARWTSRMHKGSNGPAAVGGTSSRLQQAQQQQQQQMEARRSSGDPPCPLCHFRDRLPPDSRPLWLHALSYSCKGEWSYSCDLPDWSQPDYDCSPG